MFFHTPGSFIMLLSELFVVARPAIFAQINSIIGYNSFSS
jgi:hypothetical protein